MSKKIDNNFLGCKRRLYSKKDFCINKSKSFSKIEDFNIGDINTNIKYNNFFKVSKYKILTNNLHISFFSKLKFNQENFPILNLEFSKIQKETPEIINQLFLDKRQIKFNNILDFIFKMFNKVKKNNKKMKEYYSKDKQNELINKDNLIDSNIDKIGNDKNWSENYKKIIQSVSKKLINFYRERKGIDNNDSNIDDFQGFKDFILNPLNVENFIFKVYKANKHSFDHRASRVRRLVRWILNDNNWNFINIAIHEKKYRKKSIIEDNDLILIFNFLIEQNNKTIYLISIFCLALGLSIQIISKIKKRNICLNSMVLKLYNNNNKIQRNLLGIIGYYLSSYLKEVDIKDDDFLFFNEFVEKCPLKREKYILMILINYLSKIKFQNVDKIYDVFNALNINRKNAKFKEYTFENNKFYDLKTGIGGGLVNNKINTDIIENNKLCSVSQKEKTINDFLISQNNLNSSIYEKDINFCEPNMNEIFGNNNNYSIDFQNKNTDFKLINDYSVFSEIIINNESPYKLNIPSQNDLNFDFTYKSDCLNKINKANQINFKEILKQTKIDFIDYLGLDEKINDSLLNSQDVDLFKPLNGYNLLSYYEMKKNTKLGFYFGLELVKINHNNFYLKSEIDFDENNLLFEIGAEITTKEIFEKKRKKLEIKKYWYFYLSEGIKDDSKIIFISDKGNIAYFIKSGKQNESNISLTPFIKPNKQICFLGITSKKIKKNEIIISNQILNI